GGAVHGHGPVVVVGHPKPSAADRAGAVVAQRNAASAGHLVGAVLVDGAAAAAVSRVALGAGGVIVDEGRVDHCEVAVEAADRAAVARLVAGEDAASDHDVAAAEAVDRATGDVLAGRRCAVVGEGAVDYGQAAAVAIDRAATDGG